MRRIVYDIEQETDGIWIHIQVLDDGTLLIEQTDVTFEFPPEASADLADAISGVV